MALKSNFNEAQSMRNVQVQADRLFNRIMDSFIRAGEKFIISSREQIQDHSMGTYKDVTTNLRNSIGYFIFFNGRLIHEKNDYKINRALIEHVVKDRGIQLIGIAGMNYASHVESKGYNVISYQADVCMIDLAMYLGKLDVVEHGTAARMEETFLP